MSGFYSDVTCENETKKDFIPTLHQKQTFEAFTNSSYKGMLLYHKLGSGKTCTSIMIADYLLEQKKIEKVFILSPGSLRYNWISEYCRVCGKSSDTLRDDYFFITYNYDVSGFINSVNFDNSLVIIDEVHNFVNAIKNQTKICTKIYELLLQSNCRILALSGTPVFHYVYEFAILGNMLKPEAGFPSIIEDGILNPEKFMEIFRESPEGELIPMDDIKFNKMLEGIISYFPGRENEDVPIIVYHKPIRVRMSSFQEEKYWIAREQEIKLSRPPSKSLLRKDPAAYRRLKRIYIMAKKYVMSRGASNFWYPFDNISKFSKKFIRNAEDAKKEAERIEKEREVLRETQEDDQKNIDYFSQYGLKYIPDLPVENGGWIEPSIFTNKKLLEYSPKFTALFINILYHLSHKQVIYTFFKEKSGAFLLKTLLNKCGIKTEVFSGDLDDRGRKRLLDRYNSEKNMYGNHIRILIITEAGSEGITLMDVRDVHILESSPRESRIEQAIGRVARYRSHHRLPKEDRRVDVWRYWSVASYDPITIKVVIEKENKVEWIDKTITDKRTVDEILFEEGVVAKNKINSFLKILQKNSVTTY